MIQIESLTLIPNISPDFISIQINISDTDKTLDNYIYKLLKSMAPNETPKIICEEVKNLFFIDRNVSLLTNEIDYYYKVIVQDVFSGEKLETELYRLKCRQLDEYAYWMKYQYDIYLSSIVNNGDYLHLSKIRSGQRCSCYDDIRSSHSDPSCQICFGTGYVKGFYNPSKIRINILTPKSYNENITNPAIYAQEEPLNFWCSSFPVVRIGDILVSPINLNNRYIVQKTVNTERNGYIIKQTAMMQLLPYSNIIYKMELGEQDVVE